MGGSPLSFPGEEGQVDDFGFAMPEGDLGQLGAQGQEAAETLRAVKVFASGHPEFAALWSQSVRDAADSHCALVAGQRMAGATSGLVAADGMAVPVPHGFDPYQVLTAFGMVMLAEVRRRLELMGFSAGGPG